MVKKKVVILGGGLSGLTAADSLLDKNVDLVLFEKNNYLGGLASSIIIDDECIPKYYHHIIDSNATTLKYLKRFDCLSNKEDWRRIQVSIGWDNKLTSINKLSGLLKFDYLTFWEKIRFGLFGLYVLFLLNPEKVNDDLGARTWLLKYAGKRVTDKVFYNLYSRNKFNIDLDKISARQFSYRLKEREVLDKFMFPKKGIQGIVDGLEDSIKEKGGRIALAAEIHNVDLDKKELLLESGEKYSFDLIINTIPVPEFLKVVKGLPGEYERKLSEVRYCPVIGLVFGTEDFLKRDVYWINLLQEKVHVVMQHSILMDKYKDKINWCVRYGGSEEDWDLPEDRIKKKYLEVVGRYFPGVKIKWVKLFKDKYGEPIYDIDYSKYAPKYKTPLDFLYMAGIQVTYPKIRNMNVALESGERVAEIIVSDHSL